jgi:hypothetical protein
MSTARITCFINKNHFCQESFQKLSFLCVDGSCFLVIGVFPTPPDCPSNMEYLPKFMEFSVGTMRFRIPQNDKFSFQRHMIVGPAKLGLMMRQPFYCCCLKLLLPDVPGRTGAEVSSENTVAMRNQWPIRMSVRYRSNGRLRS